MILRHLTSENHTRNIITFDPFLQTQRHRRLLLFGALNVAGRFAQQFVHHGI